MSTRGLKLKITGSEGGTTSRLQVVGVASGGIHLDDTNSGATEERPAGLYKDLADAGTEIDLVGTTQGRHTDTIVAGVLEGGFHSNQRSDDDHSETHRDVCYKMESEPRGLCYIFNNKSFEGKEKRLGTDLDKENLERVFKKLKFDVKVWTDSEALVMEARAKKLSLLDHAHYDCVVLVFLTHGREGKILGSDGDWLNVDDVTCYFKADRCPSLANKPKLFFFQSCRGNLCQRGTLVKTDGDGDDDAGGDTETPVAEVLVAPEADFFFGYSTVKGQSSRRNTETGTWYIQELVKVLDQDAQRDDLLTMMTTVQRNVDRHQSESEDGSFTKQTAEMTSRLSKKLYFNV